MDDDDMYSTAIDWGAVEIALPGDSEANTSVQVPQEQYNNSVQNHVIYGNQQFQQQQQQVAYGTNNYQNASPDDIIMTPAEFHLQQKVSYLVNFKNFCSAAISHFSTITIND